MPNVVTNILVVIFSIIFGASFYFIPYFRHIKEYKFKEYFLANKFKVVIATLMFIIALSRLFLLDLAPYGANQDEVSAGYDAYAIMTTGKDRNGMQLPAHLISWGSGQNVLYSYLIIPFLWITNNSTLALRLPMGLVSLLSIALLFDLFRRKYDYKVALFAAIFLAITPWHFMKSRWGLESNLFPEMVFIGAYFLMCYLLDKKLYKFILSSVIIGLSSYSYGTSYFFLLFFVIAVMVYLLIKKLVKWQFALLYVAIIGVIAIPIILFLYVNIFEKDSFRFLFIDIPRLTSNRFGVISSIKNGTFFKDGWENYKNAFVMLFSQRDGLPHNHVEGFGTISYIALPFALIGLFHKGDKAFINTLRIWLIVTILMLFIVSANINRMNIIFYPLIIFAFYGTMDIVKLEKRIGLVIKISYLANFLVFTGFYFSSWNENMKGNFYYTFDDAIRCSTKYEAETVYVTPYINQPYVYVLYYTKYDVDAFINTVNYTNPHGAFRGVSSFGNYVFSLPGELQEGNVYIVSNNSNPYKDVDLSNYEVTKFERYTVISTIVS